MGALKCFPLQQDRFAMSPNNRAVEIQKPREFRSRAPVQCISSSGQLTQLISNDLLCQNRAPFKQRTSHPAYTYLLFTNKKSKPAGILVVYETQFSGTFRTCVKSKAALSPLPSLCQAHVSECQTNRVRGTQRFRHSSWYGNP